MTAIQPDQKKAHLVYYTEHLNEVTTHVGMLGEKLVKNVIEYIGEANFLRVHKDIKNKGTYQSVPALRDEVRQTEFVSENAGLIKMWFYELTKETSLDAIKDVVKNNVLNRKLAGCPYDLSDVEAVIFDTHSSDGHMPANKSEIQDWFEVFCAQRMVDLIARQGSFAIQGVSGEVYDWKTVRLVICDEEPYIPNHRELSAACMKTMVFLISDTFSNYLSKNGWRTLNSEKDSSIPF
jgi:hypothetical protein